MKLFEMSTNEAADALVQITPEIGEILKDADLLAKFQDKAENADDAISHGIQIAVYSIPVLLGRYRKNIYNIIGVMNHKTQEEIGAQSLKETIMEITEIFNDEDMLSFFQSLAV